MIMAYAQNERGDEALDLFERMDLEPDRVTFVGVADACGCTRDLNRSRRLHARVSSSLVKSDIILHNTMLKMYSKCKSMKDAKALFDRMEDRSVVSWNILIKAYIMSGFPKEALLLFQNMVQEGVQCDVLSSIAALDLCASLRAFPQGRELHQSIVTSSGYSPQIPLDNAILSFYASCGRYEDAKSTFDQMRARDVVSWTLMVSVSVQNGKYRHALKLYRQMNLEGRRPNETTAVPALEACTKLGALTDGRAVHESISNLEAVDIIVMNKLIAMYSKCGQMQQARQVFDSVPHKNLYSWTIMISAYTQSDGDNLEAIRLFYKMIQEETVVPDNVAFSAAIHACANSGSLADGKAIHQALIKSELELDAVVESTLLSMYSRCGSISEARNLFEGMRNKVTGSWNTMMSAYIQAGNSSEALVLFRKMQQEATAKPDRVTYVLALSCCSSKTLVEQGKLIHAKAIEDNPPLAAADDEHFLSNTLVDVYSKAGLLDSALAEFAKMPHRDVFTWSVMIRSYARCGQGPKALELFAVMRQDYTEPSEVTFLEVLSVCSHLGLLQEAREFVLSMQQDHGLQPANGHYACLVDLLARSGKLDEVEELVECMPFQPDHVTMTSVLRACKTHGDLKRGIRVAKYVMELDTKEQTPYILASSLYGSLTKSE